MLLSAVSVLVVAQSIFEIPEGLMNNPVYTATWIHFPNGIYIYIYTHIHTHLWLCHLQNININKRSLYGKKKYSVCLRKLSNTKQGRRYILAPSHNHCCYEQEKTSSLFYCRSRRCQQYKSVQCCHGNAKMLSPCTCHQATRYFRLLLITSITHNVCVSITLVTWHANRTFLRRTIYCLMWAVSTILFHIIS